MTSQNQVGFSFQGDVIGGGSLIHAATGRLLKILSDGGVDFYAVAAAFQLGKTIPLPAAREAEITRLINGRQGRVGFLTKVLSIGWGHSEVAIELARTRAGASALVTLGALATGSSIYVAAQGFTELLMLSGCEPDMIPTVDVAKPMIAYLSPFVSDTGFRRVLENITSTAKHECSLLGRPAPVGLTATGDVTQWARSLHQLVFTATHSEEVFLIAEQRGAWLATWAAYILGMSVKLMLGDIELWESAGSQGAAIVQLGLPGPRSPPVEQFRLLPPPQSSDGQKALTIDYALRDSLTIEMHLDARVDEKTRTSVQQAVVRLTASLAQGIRMKTAQVDTGISHKINGNFHSRYATISRICENFGIPPETIQRGLSSVSHRIKAWSGTALQDHGLQYLDADGAIALRSSCGAHGSPGSNSRIAHCLCCRIGGLIHAVGATALALALCVYDADELRVRADVISGQLTTGWTRAVILDGVKMDHGFVSSTQALVHLSQLLHNMEAIQDTDVTSNKGLLAVSASASTLYFRAILDSEAFDMEGRVLAIASGRLSLRGVLRKTVVESRAPYDSLAVPQMAWRTDARKTWIAPGLQIKPFYAEGPMAVTMEVFLGEAEMVLQCYVRSPRTDFGPPVPVEILRSVNNLMVCRVGRRCKHDRDRALHMLNEHGKVEVSSFFGNLGQFNWEVPKKVFYALRGNRLEQLIQAVLIVVNMTIYQGEACLPCALALLDGRACVETIMT